MRTIVKLASGAIELWKREDEKDIPFVIAITPINKALINEHLTKAEVAELKKEHWTDEVIQRWEEIEKLNEVPNR